MTINQSRIRREKNQFKNIFHHLFLIPRLSFTPDSAAEQHRRMEDGVCSQFINLCLCCSFLLSLFPYSTAGSLPQGTDLQKWTAAVWIPSGGSTGPNRKSAPARVLLHWPQVLTGACPSLALHRLQLPSRHIHKLQRGVLLEWISSLSGYLLHHGPPWATGRQSASPWPLRQAAGESLLQCLERLLSCPLHL